MTSDCPLAPVPGIMKVVTAEDGQSTTAGLSSSATLRGTSPSAFEAVVMYCTVAEEELGKQIARDLVKKKLAACVHLGPKGTSVYEWQGKVEEDEEHQMMIKTTGDKVEAVTEAIKELHKYDLPEIIAVPVIGGSDAYLNWVYNSVKHPKG